MSVKEAQNEAENVIHYHESNMSKHFIKLLINLIKKNNDDDSQNVLHFLSDRHIVKSVYLPERLIFEAQKICIKIALDAGVQAPNFSEFMRLLLAAFVGAFSQQETFVKCEQAHEKKPQVRCFICKEPAVGFLKHPRSGKSFPVCSSHRERCLEAGWTPLEKEASDGPED